MPDSWAGLPPSPSSSLGATPVTSDTMVHSQPRPTWARPLPIRRAPGCCPGPGGSRHLWPSPFQVRGPGPEARPSQELRLVSGQQPVQAQGSGDSRARRPGLRARRSRVWPRLFCPEERKRAVYAPGHVTGAQDGRTSRARSRRGPGGPEGLAPAKGSATLKCTALAFLFSNVIFNRKLNFRSRHVFKGRLLLLLLLLLFVPAVTLSWRLRRYCEMN